MDQIRRRHSGHRQTVLPAYPPNCRQSDQNHWNFRIGTLARTLELPEDFAVLAVIKAGDLQIALRLRRDTFAPLAVLFRRYSFPPVCPLRAKLPRRLYDTIGVIMALNRSATFPNPVHVPCNSSPQSPTLGILPRAFMTKMCP